MSEILRSSRCIEQKIRKINKSRQRKCEDKEGRKSKFRRVGKGSKRRAKKRGVRKGR